MKDWAQDLPHKTRHTGALTVMQYSIIKQTYTTTGRDSTQWRRTLNIHVLFVGIYSGL